MHKSTHAGNWQNLDIKEAQRSARKNLRTCTSTTREPKTTKVANHMEKPINSLINYKPLRTNSQQSLTRQNHNLLLLWQQQTH